MKVGINGFGRIGRTILRAALKEGKKDLEFVHINDLTDTRTLAHLLKYDSVHGILDAEVKAEEGAIVVNGRKITVSAIRSPADLPWKAKGVDLVMECSGLFRKKSDAELHYKAGAPKVLVSAPASGEDITVVYGVNDDGLTAAHRMVSAASCTTNCLAPVTRVIHDTFGVKSGVMTTIHSYTNDQPVLDLPHEDLRRARAAALSMIPTSTGAAKAIGLVLPALKGLIDGLSVRVPTPNVSLVDVVFTVSRPTSAVEVNGALRAAADGKLRGILGYTEEPLVSSDFNGDPRSSIVDGSVTCVIKDTTVKILSWYDNETGFSHRMLDVARLMLTR